MEGISQGWHIKSILPNHNSTPKINPKIPAHTVLKCLEITLLSKYPRLMSQYFLSFLTRRNVTDPHESYQNEQTLLATRSRLLAHAESSLPAHGRFVLKGETTSQNNA